ncbi:MAG: hypothetical protein ACFBRM_06295 [Pikeienuella sp.]
MRVQPAAVLVFALSTPAFGADTRLEGRWDASARACAQPVSELRLTVTGSSVQFYESLCAIRERAWLGVAAAYRMGLDCEGEGETWSLVRVFLATSDGRLIDYGDPGFAVERVRCE